MHGQNEIRITSTADLGQQIRAQRKGQGLTLQDVSDHTGLGIRFISEVERGKGTAEIGKVLELCMLMGIDLVARIR